MATMTHLQSGRWLVRVEPRGATPADVAVLLPLCETLLQQAQLVAEHYDLPHGCASSICFYLGQDSPFPVTTSINAAAWPLALSSFLPPASRRPSKVDSWALPVSLPLPSSAVLTGLPICANLCFDFGIEEDANELDIETKTTQDVTLEMPERPVAPTPSANAQFSQLGIGFLKSQVRQTSSTWERRSSFQQMPYANLGENSPSPRAAIFSGPLSPATRRMRTFAFHAELRRRQASLVSTTASPRCGALNNVPVSAAATVAAAGSGGAGIVTHSTAMTSLADFIRERSRRGVTSSPRTNVSSSAHSRGPSGAFQGFRSPALGGLEDDDLEETEDGHSSLLSHSRRTTSSGASIEALRRSRSSFFSSTQGTTVWNEDDTIFEDARDGSKGRPPMPVAASGGAEASDVRRHSRLESNKGLPLMPNAAAIPFWSVSSALTSAASSSSSGTADILAAAVQRRRAQAIRVVDVATAKLISPSTAATIVGRSRAYTSVDPAQAKINRADFFAAPSHGAGPAGGALGATGATQSGLGLGRVLPAVAPAASTSTTQQLASGPPLPLKTVKVPIINRSPANGTLARRRALTMHQPSKAHPHANGVSRVTEPLPCSRRSSALTPTPTTPVPAALSPGKQGGSQASSRAAPCPGSSVDDSGRADEAALRTVTAESIESSARTPLASAPPPSRATPDELQRAAHTGMVAARASST